MNVSTSSRWGRIQRGVISPPKTYESSFIHYDFVQFRKHHSWYKAIFSSLFCYSSVVKYTSSLLQQRTRSETRLPSIAGITPSKLTGWTRPCLKRNLIAPFEIDSNVTIYFKILETNVPKWRLAGGTGLNNLGILVF